jgi:hypothetical protein
MPQYHSKTLVTGVGAGVFSDVLLYCMKPCEMFLLFSDTLAKLQKVTALSCLLRVIFWVVPQRVVFNTLRPVAI